MLEAGASEAPEDLIVRAVERGQQVNAAILEMIEKMAREPLRPRKNAAADG